MTANIRWFWRFCQSAGYKFRLVLYYTNDNHSGIVHLRTLDVAWVQGFESLGVPIVETPAKAFDMQYFLPLALLVLAAGGIFVAYFFIALRTSLKIT
jgi:hypothetical protein